jgi:hypothetical protein
LAEIKLGVIFCTIFVRFDLFTLDSECGGRDGLAESIAGPASVGAGILRVGVHDVQGDETKRVGLREPGAGLERHVVVEPLDLHGRVGHRDQSALEVSALTLLDGDVLDGGGEHRRLAGGLLRVLAPVAAAPVLQELKLLHRRLTLGRRDDLGRAFFGLAIRMLESLYVNF